MRQGINFANQDLRDRSFKGRNLIGADFSGADLRGCNFFRSQLQSASFANVRTGKSQRQIAIANINSFVMALMFAGTTMIAMILLITFVFTFIFSPELVNRDTIYWVAIVVIVVFVVSFSTAFTSRFAIANSKWLFTAIAISFVIAFGSGYFGSTFTKILVSGAFNAAANSIKFNSFIALLIFLVIEPLQIFGSLYLFRLAIKSTHTNIGTKFQYTNLTKASFKNALVIGCDFTNAINDDVDWEKAQISQCKF